MPLINHAGGGGGTPQLCSQVENFVAQPGNLEAVLLWEAPSKDEDSSFVGVRIVRKTGSAPTGINDGTVVYEGTALTYTDTGLTAGTTYYYRAFAYNAKKKYQTAMCTAKLTAVVCLRADDLPVGTLIKFNVDSKPMDFIVVHQGNPDPAVYDDTANGTWILPKLAWYNIALYTGDTNSWDRPSRGYADYGGSSLNASLNSRDLYTGTSAWAYNPLITYYDPVAVEHMRIVNVPYRRVDGTTLDKNIYTTAVKLFQPTAKEIGVTTNYSAGAKLDYFISGTGASAKQKRIAIRNDATTEEYAISWHLRDPSGESNCSYCVTEDGAIDGTNSVTNNHAVRPLSVLNFNTLFNSAPDASGRYTFYT